jgi:hypothetical protein
MRIRAVQEILWSFGKKRGAAVFLGFGVVSAQSQGFQTYSFAEASPKPKNARSERPQYFLNRSKAVSPFPVCHRNPRSLQLIPPLLCALGGTGGRPGQMKLSAHELDITF